MQMQFLHREFVIGMSSYSFKVSRLERKCIMNAKELMVKARTLLLLDHSFFGVLAMRLIFQENESIESACTDGEHVEYNSKFIESMTNPEIQFVEAHEVSHIALGDIWRRGDRDSRIWNMACDYINNKILVDAGMTMPKVRSEERR